MTKQEFLATMVRSKWKRDRQGRYKLKRDNLTFRLRIQPASLHYEILHPDGSWYKKTSDYFTNLRIVDGRLLIHDYSIPFMD